MFVDAAIGLEEVEPEWTRLQAYPSNTRFHHVSNMCSSYTRGAMRHTCIVQGALARAVREKFPHLYVGMEADAFPLWLNVALFLVRARHTSADARDTDKTECATLT